MITVRRSDERGHKQHGWLKTFHTFSFAHYYDPNFMGFRSLRVINEDVVAPESGFDFHSHDNMEILTWMIEGELTHQDSMGNKETLHPNEAQVMSAGTGVTHSEQNLLSDVSAYLLQIWIEPSAYHQSPRYAQKGFAKDERKHRWQCIASPDGREDSLPIGQDATVSLRDLQTDEAVTVPLDAKKGYWLQNISAKMTVNGHDLEPGDAIALEDEPLLMIQHITQAGDVMLFELA